MTPLPKLFIGYALIILISLLPVIITMLSGLIAGLKGQSFHEGNSPLAAFFWYSFFTIPLGVIVFIAWTIYWAMNIK
jgi:hypothetical protein